MGDKRELIPFKDKVKDILRERGISGVKFQEDTGINRANFFYRRKTTVHSRHIHMAIAYYLNLDVEDLVADTDAEIDWYGDAGI